MKTLRLRKSEKEGIYYLDYIERKSIFKTVAIISSKEDVYTISNKVIEYLKENNPNETYIIFIENFR